ncbi:hypothetical protein PM082_020111 [Marasmius tenuissimus]|nr:hypothetical protein PM082_020111 [Marasmius tenuissimus]
MWTGICKDGDGTMSIESTGPYAQLYLTVLGHGVRFSVISYTRPDARKGFEQDFRTFSTSLTSNTAQVYAVDTWMTLSLILYGDLIPAAHFSSKLGVFAEVCLYMLSVA